MTHAHTLARLIKGCVVETQVFDALAQSDLEGELEKRNRYPGESALAGVWIALDGKFKEDA